MPNSPLDILIGMGYKLGIRIFKDPQVVLTSKFGDYWFKDTSLARASSRTIILIGFHGQHKVYDFIAFPVQGPFQETHVFLLCPWSSVPHHPPLLLLEELPGDAYEADLSSTEFTQ